MIFISSGHDKIKDPGAIANGVKEADLAIEFKNLVAYELSLLGAGYKTDVDTETLGEYLKRINTGNGSVVIEFHFDAASADATGSTVLIEDDADRLDLAFAKEVVDTTSSILGIKNRGVKPESNTRHGKLALMKENGLICLLELCFITNKNDLAKYNLKKKELARSIAQILLKYEKLIP